MDTGEPTFAQSACVAVQIGLVDLLASWNLVPATVVGHSSGEIAAAYCAGRISRQAAWKAGFWRGCICAERVDGHGAMLAAGISEEEAHEVLGRLGMAKLGDAKVGCVNSPKNVTITGTRDTIAELKRELDRMGLFSRLLSVKVAYHSPSLGAVAEEYLEHLGNLDFGDKINQDRDIRMYSSATGQCFGPGDAIESSYWVESLVSPLKFSSALVASLRSGKHSPSRANKAPDTVVEIGPHPALRRAIAETLETSQGSKSVGYTYVNLLKRGDMGSETILHAMGSLYCSGYDADLDAVNRNQHGGNAAANTLHGLPPYAFNCASRRAMTRQVECLKFPVYGRHELLGMPVSDSNEFEQRWRNVI